jgi:hypothetical protein
MKPTLDEIAPCQNSEAGSLAIVTENYVVIRDPERQCHTIIALSRLSGMKRIITSHPVLLVIAVALFVISAAAFCSKEDNGTYLTIFSLGLAAAGSYWLSRTAAVALIAGSESVVTPKGSLSEARSLIADVQSALADPQS